MVDFSPLWITMKQKGISQYDLIKNGIDKHTMDRLRNNQNVTVLTIEKLVRILHCTPDDILTFTDDEKK